MLSKEDLYYALIEGGVEHWEGYEIAINIAKEDGYDWEKITPTEKFDYLESVRVYNWELYEEAIYTYKVK